MRTLVFTDDRNKLVRANAPDWQTQIDAIWTILQNNPAVAAQVAADPVYQKVMEVKARYPKQE